MSKILFTADQHFGHTNVIEYAHRPFASAQEMDREMVRRWNEVVAPGDLVYHLGDFGLCHRVKAAEILAQLNGQKFLVFGNHDKILRKHKPFLDQFVWARDLTEIDVPDTEAAGGKQRITLCHYAMKVWNRAHHGAWQLHGHSHGSLPDDAHALQLDVGVDCWGFAPVPYDAVKAKMKTKTWKPIDHHVRRDDV